MKHIEKTLNICFDLCVIGSGPAGIITALEYARSNSEKSVLLVEFGLNKQPAKNQLDNSIIINNRINHHDPYECTNKGFGGTSATWGGRCVMYDEIDFEDRPILNGNCTWDNALYNDINNYIKKSATYFECGNSEFDLNKISHQSQKRIAEGFEEDDVVTDSVIERWSMPTRFGVKYAKEIKELKNITLISGFEARDFSSPDSEGNIEYLTIRNVVSKHIFKLKSKKFVLAAGAQETTRILLRNTQVFSLVNGKSEALGKFYQGHLSGKIASVNFYNNPKKTNYDFIKDQDGIYLRRRFQFTSAYLKQNNLLNTAIWLDNPLYFDPSHKNGPMSFMYLAMITPIIGKKLAPAAIANSITKGKTTGIKKHLQNILKQLPGSLLIPASIFVKRYLHKRKLPGVFLYNPENKYALHFHAEQIPFKNNQMVLSPDGETLQIYYDLTDDDIKSVIKLHKALDNSLRKQNCGELQYWYTEDELPGAIKQMSKDGIHQSGTTRIADSPELGVVNRDLKVWGTQNLYLCSSSVFPTSGQANPTFLLGAFAVRLAQYLSIK